MTTHKLAQSRKLDVWTKEEVNRDEGGCVRGKSQTTEKNNLTSASTWTTDTLKSILEALAVLTNLIQVTREDTALVLGGISNRWKEYQSPNISLIVSNSKHRYSNKYTCK